MSYTQVQAYLVDQLKELGIVAATRSQDLHSFPAVLLAPAQFTYNRLSKQAFTAEFEAYIIARDSGVKDQPLDDLYTIASQLAEAYGADVFEAVSVTLASNGGDNLPALKTTITLHVKEKRDEE